jgi:hypothetical protein
VFIIVMFFESVDGARAHPPVPRQVTHMAAGTRGFLKGTGPTGRGQGVIADGRGDSSLS